MDCRLGSKGFRYWDVDGTPVETSRIHIGLLRIRAFDVRPPRPFPLNRIFEDGTPIDMAAFAMLFLNPRPFPLSDTCREFGAAR